MHPLAQSDQDDMRYVAESNKKNYGDGQSCMVGLTSLPTDRSRGKHLAGFFVSEGILVSIPTYSTAYVCSKDRNFKLAQDTDGYAA